MRMPLRRAHVVVAAGCAAIAIALEPSTVGAQSTPMPATVIPAPMGTPSARVLVPPSPQTPTVVISAQGVASRTADEATVTATIVANDDVAANATARSNDIYAALQSKLAAVGIDASAIRTVSFYVNYVPRPGATYPPGVPGPAMPTPFTPPGYPAPRYGYVASRSLSIAVRPIERAGAVIDAALSAGATSVGNVQYALANRDTAYGDALASAMREAETQARVVATAARMRLGRLVQVQAGTPMTIPTMALRVPYGNLSNAVPVLPPPRVEIRANVTVTYALLP